MRDLNRMLHSVGVMLALLAVVGCVSGTRPVLNRGVLENLAGSDLTDVKAVHHPTGTTAFFSRILQSSKAELGFTPQEMRSDWAEISWIQAGRRYQARLQLPKHNAAKGQRPHWLIYKIYDQGRVTVELVPMGDNSGPMWPR